MSALSKASPVLVATFGAASLPASLALPPGGVGSAAADCSPVTVGIDTSLWNGHSRATALGAAEGQTFLARDTLISRLTVWRTPLNVNGWGCHLFITTVALNPQALHGEHPARWAQRRCPGRWGSLDSHGLRTRSPARASPARALRFLPPEGLL